MQTTAPFKNIPQDNIGYFQLVETPDAHPLTLHTCVTFP